MLHEVVDDPALQLERHDLEQKYTDGQQQEKQLVQTLRFQNIAEYVAGHFGCTARTRRLRPDSLWSLSRFSVVCSMSIQVQFL